MSKKNKPWNKSARRQKRFNTDGSSHSRSDAAAPVLREIATRILSDPKRNVVSRVRRKLARQRCKVVEIPRPRLTHPAVKLALKLSKLPLEKLHRRLAQSARRAATIKEILSDMVPGSQFAAPLEAEHINQIGILKQVRAEIISRRPR